MSVISIIIGIAGILLMFYGLARVITNRCLKIPLKDLAYLVAGAGMIVVAVCIW